MAFEVTHNEEISGGGKNEKESVLLSVKGEQIEQQKL